MNRTIEIDHDKGTLTAQAGLQFIDASKALRAHDLQFMTNIEIGNMTLGSAARCSTAVQGDLGRNALRGFGATQVDLTLRRQFQLRERLALQARADLFNIFNHPNFGSPINYLSSPLFGQSTQMLGASLGSGGQNGGLNPLYQIGGSRSVQLALKLLF